jgi:hypothetical protein
MRDTSLTLPSDPLFSSYFGNSPVSLIIMGLPLGGDCSRVVGIKTIAHSNNSDVSVSFPRLGHWPACRIDEAVSFLRLGQRPG